jgi:hypothetical protein
MGTLTQWLSQYVKAKLSNAWLVKERLYLIRALFLGLAVILTILIGITVTFSLGSAAIGILAATASFSFFAPGSILLADYIWTSIKTQTDLNNSNGLNLEKWLNEQEQEDRLRLAGYGFGPEKLEEKLGQTCDDYRSLRKQLRADVLKKYVNIEFAEDAQSKLKITQSTAIDVKNINKKNGNGSKKVNTKTLPARRFEVKARRREIEE